MSVVPEQQTLIIEGKLSPQWIDKVAPGQSADLLFTAFNQNLTPKLRGELTMISADRLINPANGEPYYQIQIVVPEMAAAQVIKPVCLLRFLSVPVNGLCSVICLSL